MTDLRFFYLLANVRYLIALTASSSPFEIKRTEEDYKKKKKINAKYRV